MGTRPPEAPKRPGPPPKPLDEALKVVVVEYAQRYPSIGNTGENTLNLNCVADWRFLNALG